MSIVDLTYTRVKIDQDDHQQIVEKLMPEIIYQHSVIPCNSVAKSNFGGWQSETTIYNDDCLDHPLKPIYQKTFEEFSKLIINNPVREYLNLNLSFEYWINVNFKGDLNIPHYHMPFETGNHSPMLSGTYYLKKPKQSGNIVFITDRSYYKKWFVGDFDDSVDVDEGELLLFPPHLMHYVEPNLSDDMRVSIAFNIVVAR